MDDLGTAQRILDMGFSSSLAARYREELFKPYLAESGLFYLKLIMEILRAKGVVDLNKRYQFFDVPRPETVLVHAVRLNNKDVVDVALASGTHPDGVKGLKDGLEYPARYVTLIARCSTEILELLLLHGAQVHRGSKDLSSEHLGRDHLEEVKTWLDDLSIPHEKQKLVMAELVRRAVA